jgi:AAA family ATP:ADP antiporter
MLGSISRLLRRAVDIKENEVAALVWSCVYFFLILTSYYILRPIRDEVGAVLGVKPSGADDLAWMFTGTLVGVLLVHPLFASMVAKMPRKRFVPLIYRFFISHLVIFYLLYKFIDPKQGVWIGYVFFVWVSIFNLFVVSVFWSFMTDIYQPGQSKRLFGVVAVGGTIGALTGSSITSLLVEPLGALNLLLVSALFLELACQASRRLARHEPKLATVEDSNEAEVAAATTAAKQRNEEVIGGGMMEGVKRVMASPYLLGITGIMLFFTVSSTFLYFQKAVIVKEYFGDDSAARTAFFANVDLATNVLTLITQLFITGRVMRLLGVGVALGFLPIISLIGFGVLAVSPVLGVLVALEALRRAGNYAVQRPARETLYLVLPRTDKYKSKNFNDTFVYRAGDQLGAWSYAILGKMGIGISGLAFSMIPFSIAWLILALWLGRKNHRLQEERNA